MKGAGIIRELILIIAFFAIFALAIPPLKVGILDVYPIHYTDRGIERGLGYDLVRYISSRRGMDVIVVSGSAEELRKMLEEGKLDLVLTYRDGRGNFGREVVVVNWGSVISKKGINSIFEMRDLSVAVAKDDVFAEEFVSLAKDFCVSLRIIRMDSYEDVLKAVENAEVDVGVVDRFFSSKTEVKHLKTPLNFHPIDLRFSGREDVLKAFDEELAVLKSNPRSYYWRLVDLYLPEGEEFPWMSLFAFLVGVGAVALAVFISLQLTVRRRTRELLEANERLKQAKRRIEDMGREVEELYRRLQDTFRKFQEVMILASQVGTFEQKEEDFLRNALKSALDLVPKAKYGAVSFIEGEKWRFVAAIGHDEECLKSLSLKSEYAILDLDKTKVVDKIMTKNTKKMPPDVLERLRECTKGIRSTILSPIKVGEKLVGFLSLDIPAGSEEEFDYSDVEVVDKFSKIISGFYAARKYFEMEGKFHKNIVLALVKALEYYDTYTRGHSERVARYSADTAEKMGLPKERIKRVYWAALVHDIGKIFIPQRILNKPGRLTEEEFEMVKIHPVKGYEVLMEAEGMEDIALIVRHHHERCDGKGYPDGLTCEQIPLESRIITVADAFDAMTSTRSYRDPLSVSEALDEILKNSGTQFDPRVVDTFVEYVRERGIKGAAAF